VPRLLALLAAVTLGCTSPTVMHLDVTTGGDGAPSSAWHLSVFDLHHALESDHVIQSPPQAGRIDLELPDSSQSLRVALAADPQGLDGAAVAVRAHGEVSQSLLPRPAAADQDHDLVPDKIDNCPYIPNADQMDTDGDMVGDACQTGGPSLCDGSTPLCDGFEKQMIDGALWTLDSANCTMTPDATHVYRGSQSLHLTVGAQSPNRCLIHWLGQPPTTFYLRAFYYMDPVPAGYLSLFGLYDTTGGIELDLVDSAYSQQDNYGNTTPGNTSITAKMQSGRWECVEWGITIANGMVDMRAWLDGTEATDAHHTGQLAPPAAGSLFVGLAGQAANVWLDEVELSPSPIGCAR
jgi:hypothetical protein